MKEYQKEILKLSASEALNSIFALALPFFEASRIYRVNTRKLREEIDHENSNMSDKIRYLKRYGFINEFVLNKENYFEITTKGIARMNTIQLDNMNVPRPDGWDKKWWLVIFDVPNKRKLKRDIFRRRLNKIGFIQVQESVYVYPFKCSDQITAIAKNMGLNDDVLLLVSEIIQGEEKIIKRFIDANILFKSDLK